MTVPELTRINYVTLFDCLPLEVIKSKIIPFIADDYFARIGINSVLPPVDRTGTKLRPDVISVFDGTCTQNWSPINGAGNHVIVDNSVALRRPPPYKYVSCDPGSDDDDDTYEKIWGREEEKKAPDYDADHALIEYYFPHLYEDHEDHEDHEE